MRARGCGISLRQRRFKRGERSGGPDSFYEQTSNAYSVTAPARIMELLLRWMRPAPVPINGLSHADARAEEWATMGAGHFVSWRRAPWAARLAACLSLTIDPQSQTIHYSRRTNWPSRSTRQP